MIIVKLPFSLLQLCELSPSLFSPLHFLLLLPDLPEHLLLHVNGKPPLLLLASGARSPKKSIDIKTKKKLYSTHPELGCLPLLLAGARTRDSSLLFFSLISSSLPSPPTKLLPGECFFFGLFILSGLLKKLCPFPPP